MTAEPSFGDLLREHRRTAGFSQESLAERAGLSVGAVAALEQGIRRAPYRKTVAALADALGLSTGGRRTFDEVAASARRRHLPSTCNLPLPLTSFVERNEVDELIALLADHRLVTITGTGGIGKTRIAIESEGSDTRASILIDVLALPRGSDDEAEDELAEVLPTGMHALLARVAESDPSSIDNAIGANGGIVYRRSVEKIDSSRMRRFEDASNVE